MPDRSSVAAVLRRDQILIWTCIAVVTALAWAYLVNLSRQMSVSTEYIAAMARMGMTVDKPWTATDLWLTFVMWFVMMVGMMSGAAAPVLLLFAAARARRGRPGPSLSVLAFGFGYAAIWLGFSASAAAAQWALHDAALLSSTMAASSPHLGGAILIAAGVYQLSPWKGACLMHCRTPLGFLMTNWREGLSGAFQMGLRHGTYCLGCCWALMGVLFAVGVMNLVWVAALTVLVLLEKVGPAGMLIARAAGIVLAVVGVVLLAGMAGSPI